jgi:DNA-binding MarR family transcriptional regulator
MLLNQAAYAVANRLTAALGELGISVRVYCALAKTTMVVTLDEMEQRGLAERRLSPTDRRAHVVAITPEGRRLVTKADRIVQGVYDDVLGTVGAKQRAEFVAVLQQLVAGPLASPFHMDKPARRRRRPSEA